MMLYTRDRHDSQHEQGIIAYVSQYNILCPWLISLYSPWIKQSFYNQIAHCGIEYNYDYL